MISKAGRGGRRYPPYAFTEQGVAMLSSVLGSDRAIAVNIEIMRAFVRMRELLSSNKELARLRGHAALNASAYNPQFFPNNCDFECAIRSFDPLTLRWSRSRYRRSGRDSVLSPTVRQPVLSQK